MNTTYPVVGLALGSGSSRGWAHIGVIQALEEMGIRPQVVAGASIGALVGAVYVCGELEPFSQWVKSLRRMDVFNLLDLSLGGGIVKGEKLFSYFQQHHPNPPIESLAQRYVSVATAMHTGREVWLRQGPIMAAARASCALPGLLAPVEVDGQWMLDGGLVNPVPVSACRALGADVVIAVNLNTQMLGGRAPTTPNKPKTPKNGLWDTVSDFLSHKSPSPNEPGILDVVSASIHIMQDRITRSRMAGDPAEIILQPQLQHLDLMDFHRADEAIEEGRQQVLRHAKDIWAAVNGSGVR